MPRFFVPTELISDTELELPAAAAQHVRVLRLPPGAAITLFDGRGGEYAAELASLAKKQVRVRVGEHRAVERESPLEVTLIQGISKGERMDLTMQKAVELGASAIWPVFSARSVVRLDGARLEKRLRHWEGVVASACEQCGRNRLPAVLPAADIAEVWSNPPAGKRLVLDPEGKEALPDLDLHSQPLALLVGPEGGLTDEELRTARAAGFTGVRLGPRVLRTETAGLACLAALQVLHGDLRE